MSCACRDKYRYLACLLRERFDKNKDVKDMVKATELLKAGQEEFWAHQHPQPYIFPDSPGGTSYERYECYKVRGLWGCAVLCLGWLLVRLPRSSGTEKKVSVLSRL